MKVWANYCCRGLFHHLKNGGSVSNVPEGIFDAGISSDSVAGKCLSESNTVSGCLLRFH